MTVKSKRKIEATEWTCMVCFKTNYFPPNVYCSCGQGWLDVD